MPSKRDCKHLSRHNIPRNLNTAEENTHCFEQENIVELMQIRQSSIAVTENTSSD